MTDRSLSSRFFLARFGHGLALSTLVCAPLQLACAPLQQDPDDFDQEPGAGRDEPGPRAPEDLTIELGPSNLEIDPGHAQTLVITVNPPDEYTVILAVVGQGNGAFLDSERVETDADGQATVALTVPFETPGFSVRASVFDEAAELDVDVGRALGTVVVEPSYDGTRAVDGWLVKLSSQPCPPNGSEAYERGDFFPVGEPIVFENVAANKPVQLLARAEHYAYGCASGVNLLPGVENVVSLPITDLPLVLENLDMKLSFYFERGEFATSLVVIIDQMLSAFRSALASDTDGLLTAMSENYALRAPAFGRPRFDLAAQERGWAQQVNAHLVELNDDENPLSLALRGWLDQGSSLLFSDRDFFVGRLQLLDEVPADDGAQVPNARFDLQRVGPLTPAEAQMPDSYSVTLTPQVRDRLSVGFVMTWKPSRLLAELARESADEEDLLGVTNQLETLVDCEALAERLAQVSQTPDEPLPLCDVGCLGQLCDDALGWMWTRAQQLAPNDRPLEFSAAGDVEIDNFAHPVAFGGSWAGATTLFDGTEDLGVSLRGPFSAVSDP